mgnify:CR=1 FL=1
MRYLVLVLALTLAACDGAQPQDVLKKTELSFDDLERLPTDCSRKDSVQKKLKFILATKNFDPNPDNLDTVERAYQSKAKATYWWYEYSCGDNS